MIRKHRKKLEGINNGPETGDGTYLEGEEDSDQYGTNEALLGDETLWVGHAYERYDFLSEGDSPAWFLVIPNGLRSLEDLSYGGWNGRYAVTAPTT